MTCTGCGCLREDLDRLRKTVRKIALALEGAVKHGEIDEWTESLWDAYETARNAIGLPIKTYPGGYDDHHIHWLEMEEGTDDEPCETCDEQAVARAEGLVEENP